MKDFNKESFLDTFGVPQIATIDGVSVGNGTEPRVLAQAREIPLRVLVRNRGQGGDVLLAFDQATLQNVAQKAQTFGIPSGASEVIVVMPGQILFAASPSASVIISIAVSPGLPVA